MPLPDAEGRTPMNIEDIIQRIQRLGFDEAEARVYVKLLQNGPSRASTISELTDLNRTKVYRLLDKLVEERVVSASVGRPTIYQAEEPTDVFAQLREALRAEERTLDRIEADLEEPLRDVAVSGHEVDRPDWTIIEGYPRIYNTLHRLIREANESLTLVSNDETTTNLVPFVEDAWEEAVQRAADGVEFRALLNLDDGRDERVAKWANAPNVEARHLAIEDPIHYVLIDNERALKWLVLDENGRTQMDDGAAILTNAPGLVTSARVLADTLWDASKPLPRPTEDATN